MLTVGIATYNRAKYLRECLISLSKQTYRDFKIIVSDNCSTDGTRELCQTLDTGIPITYVRQPRNMGGVCNMNYLLSVADTEYFAWVGDDDLVSENYFDRLMKNCLLHRESNVISIGVPATINQDGELLRKFDSIEKYRLNNTLDLNQCERIYRVYKYGGQEEWAWGVIYGVFKTEVIAKIRLTEQLHDPGALFVRQAVIANNVVIARDSAIYYKRMGGESSYTPWSFNQFIKSFSLNFKALTESNIQCKYLLVAHILISLVFRHLFYHIKLLSWITAKRMFIKIKR